MNTQSIAPAIRSMLERQLEGENGFIEFVCNATECTPEEAIRVLNHYRKQRLVKIDPVSGGFHVKHGALLDASVLRRALEMTARS